MNISRRNTAPVIIDRKETNYTNKIKILGVVTLDICEWNSIPLKAITRKDLPSR